MVSYDVSISVTDEVLIQGVVAVKKKVASELYVLLIVLATQIAGCSSEATGGLTLSGTVEARETVLSFQVGGRIERLLTDEGATVKSGQEVALLVAADYDLAVQRAKSEVDAAAAALAALESGTRKQELKVSEATLAQAKAELRFADEDVKRVQSLIRKHLAAQEQLDQAKLKRDVAKSTVSRAEQQLQLLREGPRQEEITQAHAALEGRRSALQSAERQLNYTRLISPINGTVSLRQAEAGEMISAGQPVFTVAELTRPWVRAYLNETDLARVKLGQSATVSVDGLPGKTFRGRLAFISPKAEFTPKAVETRALRVDLVYRVKIELEDPDGLLKLGMPADVVFDAGS
jgi:HlyD family secretion protein